MRLRLANAPASGAANRSRAKERAKELAAAGQLELKFLVRVADCEPLVRPAISPRTTS